MRNRLKVRDSPFYHILSEVYVNYRTLHRGRNFSRARPTPPENGLCTVNPDGKKHDVELVQVRVLRDPYARGVFFERSL